MCCVLQVVESDSVLFVSSILFRVRFVNYLKTAVRDALCARCIDVRYIRIDVMMARVVMNDCML